MPTDPYNDDRSHKYGNRLRKPSPTKSITNDAGNRRYGEKRLEKDVELGKLEPKPRRPHTPASTPEEHGNGRPVEPQPASNETKPLPSTVDSTQPVRGGSNHPNPPTSTQLPPGASPPSHLDNIQQNPGQTHVATGVTTASRHGSKAPNNKPDDVPSTTPPVPDVQLGVADPEASEPDGSPPDVRKKPPLEANQGEILDSRPHSDSDRAMTNPAAQDPGLTSGMFGGIANALGMRPPSVKELRLLAENHKLKEDNKILRTEYRSADSALRRYYQEAYRLSHENQRLNETVEAVSLELKGVTKRYEETKALSETRGKELVGAQVFLTKADALSISELIQKVDGLNDEIYQAAASLGETIVQKKLEPSEYAYYSPEQKSTAETLLGPSLCKVLRNRARKADEGINPLLVQITLQAFFVVFCIQRIRSWTSSDFALDKTLREIYEKIWISSDQAVSGRWRALTRAQLKPDTNEWIKELMSELDAILAMASWELSTPEDKHTLEARLPAIFRVVLDVRESIGEKFTSADIEVAYVEPLTPFTNSYMEEAYPADSEVGHEKEPDIVITMVGMGLHKVVPLHGSRGYECALAPKVVLDSSLRKALEPPPPRTNRSKSVKR